MRYHIWYTWTNGQKTLIATAWTRALAEAVIRASALPSENLDQYSIEDTEGRICNPNT